MQVRIARTPPGEAPLEVREAWVGLVLPLRAGEVGPPDIKTQGVLTGPRTFLGYLVARLLGRFKTTHGYCVDGPGAVRVLAERDRLAAIWWQTNVPTYVQPGGAFIFHAECCQLVETPPPTLAAPADLANPGGPYTTDVS